MKGWGLLLPEYLLLSSKPRVLITPHLASLIWTERVICMRSHNHEAVIFFFKPSLKSLPIYHGNEETMIQISKGA